MASEDGSFASWSSEVVERDCDRFATVRTLSIRRCAEGVLLGSTPRLSFPSSDSRSTGVLDLIHTDVCGPMSRVSLGGCEYYVTFIDDHSRKTWIYFLKTKSEVFKRFQEFKALVENQTGRKIKVLRSDNGGEYTSTEFADFCTQQGIRRQLTVPYNPQAEWGCREEEQGHSWCSEIDVA
jgi:transposase InsO family protein